MNLTWTKTLTQTARYPVGISGVPYVFPEIRRAENMPRILREFDNHFLGFL